MRTIAFCHPIQTKCKIYYKNYGRELNIFSGRGLLKPTTAFKKKVSYTVYVMISLSDYSKPLLRQATLKNLPNGVNGT